MLKLDKKQLCNILGVKVDRLKVIEKNNNLESRLLEKGYNLIDRSREGRKIIYILEQLDQNKEIYNNLVKTVFNTNKENEFTKYFTLRTANNDKYPLNKADISQKVNVSTKTVTKWDNTLINKKIIAKDGFYYFCMDKDKNTIKQCSKEEYKSYWKNKAIENNIKKLVDLYYNGKITITEMLKENSNFTTKVNMLDNKYYFRVKKYKTNEDNQLYIDIFNLIKSIYGNDKEFTPEYEIININDIKFIPLINFKRIKKNTYKSIKIRKL